ncbi:MAG TPA: ATP-dependent Clp protease proteolytic subunit [Thermodesulfobacteriota bacterium]|nr:ATP-dependent Clp protease proteolytic subunit [Thermodesulfobacteriota bacterium]
MPTWNQVLHELQSCNRVDALDFVRRKYLKKFHKKTNRNIIAYYSGWLQYPNINLGNAHICDDDKNGFMATIHGIDRSRGLDLILHTPGGDIAATESIVNYLMKMFGNDIRIIIPQIAMSAGTMIACSGKEIIMGKQSNIGPIDPQYGGIPCHGVIAEFKRALEEIKVDPSSIPIWQTVVGKYHPTFIGECQHAIDWSRNIVISWLKNNMFSGQADADAKAIKVVDKLGSHDDTKTHARHMHMEEVIDLLTIKSLENDFDQDFQDLVLTVHHAYMHTFANSKAIRIIENHLSNAIVFNIPKS